MHVRRAAAAVAPPLTLLLALLSSCSDSDEPNAEPTDDITLPTPSSSSAAPEPEPETAKQFIRRWRKVSDTMQNTGKTQPYLRLSRQCEACSAFAETVSKVYAANGSITFAGTDVLQISRVGGSPSRPTFDVEMSVGNTEYVERKGADPKTLPGGRKTYLVSLRRVDGEWFVTDLLQRSR